MSNASIAVLAPPMARHGDRGPAPAALPLGLPRASEAATPVCRKRPHVAAPTDRQCVGLVVDYIDAGRRLRVTVVAGGYPQTQWRGGEGLATVY